uniref:Thyroglobulin type-1 domain-containing protein n=1 Tax=Parastrongyloides trichosuri TaxID=131310 RepID=A0A0N4Z821_PARTI
MVSATSQPQVPNPTNIPHPVINCRSWENVCKVEHFLDATNGNAFIQSGCAMAPIGLVTLSPKCNYNDVYGNWECYCATDVIFSFKFLQCHSFDDKNDDQFRFTLKNTENCASFNSLLNAV